MPLYRIDFTYSTEAWQALANNPQDRRAPLRALAERLGGRQSAALLRRGRSS